MKLATALAALAAAVVLAASAQVRPPSSSATNRAARAVVEAPVPAAAAVEQTRVEAPAAAAPLLRAQGGASQGTLLRADGGATQGKRFSNVRDLSPLDEIDAAVGLTDEQRPVVTGLVIEREAAMHAAYSEAVLERGDREAGIAGVTEIYEAYYVHIRQALTTDQQAKLDEARRAGRVGKPMFVFTYGSE
jgi:hypothetical protein